MPDERPARLGFIRTAALLVALIGGAVMFGWAFDIPALRSLVAGAVEMKANTATGLLVAALGLWLGTHRPAPAGTAGRVACAIFTLALGAATLLQYTSGIDLRIDELLVRDTGAAYNQIKGRMSPYSAVAFCAIGVGLLGSKRPGLVALGRIGGGVTIAIGLLSIIGYLWNAAEIVTDRFVPPVAVNTATAFVLLGASILWLSRGAAPTQPHHARTRLESLVLGGLVPTALFVLIGGGLTYESGAGFARAAERVAHTQQVRAELGRLRTALADAEAARRNVILTGEDVFERAFRADADAAERYLASLGKLVADNPAQLQLHREVGARLRERLAALEAIGAVHRADGQEAARVALGAYVRGAAATDFGMLIARMDAVEDALLRARLRQVEERRVLTLLSLLVTLAVLIAVFALLLRSIRREVAARTDAERAVRDLNAELEARIAARTEALQHQQAFLRRVIDLDRNLIFAKDAQGRFVLANQAFAEALGTTVDGLLGRSAHEFSTRPGNLDRHDAAHRQVIERGEEVVIAREKVVDPSGNARWYTTVKRPMPAQDGASAIVLGVSVEITGLIEAEHEIRQLNAGLEKRVEERTRELRENNVLLRQARVESEAATRAKSAFLANMSHEIRTPMNAVIGLTHLMLRETSDRLQRERLGKVAEAAKHLLQVINDILDMSKIEAGKMALEQIDFSLEEVLSGAIAMVSSHARDKGLELILDPDHLPDRVVGDRTRLSQILINLLSNAVKFTEYGWVRLRGRMESELGQRIELRFEVQDTGPGVPLDRQPLLFGAFEQADASISRQHGGTGLGLALSRQLARAMGGEAGVVSAPGSGSVFWFSVFLARAAEQPRKVASLQMSGRRALLVDDLPESLIVIGERLGQLGLEVDAADSGSAALARAQAEVASGRPYDVMVIDWRMVPMDGIETLERLRGVLGEGIPPAILVTAFDDADLHTRARAAGFRAVLLKPVTQSTLQDALARILSSTHELDELEPITTTDGETLVRARHADQRVLLAEDNPVNREVAEQLLASAGLIVDSAWDGARAAEMALSRHYDLILMDVQMPIMDGLEATREIRARAGHRTPIVAMTANAFAEDRQAALEAGMNDHLTKPVDPPMLYAMLLRWLPLRRGAEADTIASGFGGLSHDDLHERLAAIADIDLPAALRNVAGQPTALARVLARFAETYALGLPLLLDTAGDPQAQVQRWLTACHSVRAALGAIGAHALLGEVTLLERQLADAVPLDELAPLGEGIHHGLLQLVARAREQLNP